MSKKASDYFIHDKIRGKRICQVVISGNEKDGNIKLCNKELTYFTSTSGMNGHLRSYHKHIKFNTKNQFQNEGAPTSIKSALLNENHYEVESIRYKTLTNHVIDFLTATNQPLSLVDNPSFIKMLNKFDNTYMLPGRQTITNKYVKTKVETVKRIIENEITEAEFVSIKLDGWSSLANNPYLGKHLF